MSGLCEESALCLDLINIPVSVSHEQGWHLHNEHRDQDQMRSGRKSWAGGRDGVRMKERRRGYQTNPHIQRRECQRKQGPQHSAACWSIWDIKNKGGSLEVIYYSIFQWSHSFSHISFSITDHCITFFRDTDQYDFVCHWRAEGFSKTYITGIIKSAKMLLLHMTKPDSLDFYNNLYCFHDKSRFKECCNILGAS